MDSPGTLLELLNAAAGAGRVTVDAKALGLVLDALALSLAALLAAALVTGALAARRFRPGGAKAAGERGVAREEHEKRGRELEEMASRTNDRNNYINSVFSSIEDGIVVVDAEGRVVLYNPQARQLLGIGPSVFFDQAPSDPADDGGTGEAPLGAVLAACSTVTASRHPELRRLENPAGRELEVRVLPIVDKYRKTSRLGAIAVVKDVTELRRLEGLRKDFVANVSHEFRTPLTLISGFVEMLTMGDRVPATDRQRAFEIIDIETERLKRLISELLTLSEIEDELPRQVDEAIDVDAVLSGIIASLGSLAARKGQTMSADLALDAARLGGRELRGNENWFWQACKNLVENAIKYTPEGGSIRVVSRVEGDEVLVSVADTGIGIEADEIDRIFERFYRVEKARGSRGGGSGLGLALVKDIVSIFGGTVSVDSSVGVGSEFTLRLPTGRARQAHD